MEHDSSSATLLRRQVDAKLQRDQSKVDFLRDSLAKSQNVTRKVGNILTSFGDRLTTLESAIRPLRQESMALTRGRDNLQRVMQLMDDVLEYYDASQKVDGTLQEGPKYQLDTYLEAMDKVSAAQNYFMQHNSDNPELHTLTALRESGIKSLESEFRQVLERHSFAISAADLIEQPREQVVSGNILPDDVVQTLHKIANFLHQSDSAAGLCKRYTEVRCNNLSTTLGSFDTGAKPLKKSGTSASTMPKLTVKGIRPSLRRRKPDASSQREEVGSSKEKEAASFLDMHIDNQPGAYEIGSHPFLKYVKAVVRLLQRETALARKVLPEKLVPEALSGIFVPAVEAIASQASLLAASAGRQVNRQEYFSLVYIFDLLLYFKANQADFEALLNTAASDEAFSIHNDVVIGFADVARRCLVEFEQSFQKDAGKKNPHNGTVHEVTSNALAFVNVLYEFAEVAGNVLRGPEALGSRKDGLNWAGSATSDKFLIRWIGTVLLQLCANLSKKARAYDNQALSSVFLINNYDYIMRTMLQSQFCDLLQTQEPEFETNYRQRMETQRQMYMHCTWGKIDEHLVIDQHEGVLTKKERETIKEKYSGFNSEFEEIIRVQQQFSVPNDALREDLRRANLEYLVPKYKKFDQVYRHSGFTSKNPQKYLRFTPDEVAEQLELVFDD